MSSPINIDINSKNRLEKESDSFNSPDKDFEKDKYFKNVRIKMDTVVMNHYIPPRGIDMVVYPRKKYFDGQAEQWTVDPGYANVSFTTASVNPDPLQRRYMEDIEKILSKLPIQQDNLSEKDEPQLLRKPLIRFGAILEQPALDNDMDFLRSRAKNVRRMKFSPLQAKDIVERFQRNKSLYNKQSLSRFSMDSLQFKEDKEFKQDHEHKYVELTWGEW